MPGVSFEDRVVIITGGAAGLGRTYALEIARRGGAVVLNDLGCTIEGYGADPARTDAVVAEIVRANGRAIASYDSVAAKDGGKRMVEAALDTYGRVDALINNAGTLRLDLFENVSEEDFDALLSTHLIGTWRVTQAVWPHLKAQNYGRVVFTTSGAGMLGMPTLSAYGSAKAGIAGMMHVLSEEGAPHGVLCNAIHPNALGRMLDKMAADNDPGDQASSESLTGAVGQSMQPDFTTPMTVFLASEACKTTHSIYSSLGGRFARVFVGVTEGWQGSRQVPSTVEDVAQHIEEIRDPGRGYGIPTDLMNEYVLLLKNHP